jgi:hypothetical protein
LLLLHGTSSLRYLCAQDLIKEHKKRQKEELAEKVAELEETLSDPTARKAQKDAFQKEQKKELWFVPAPQLPNPAACGLVA